MQEKEGSLFQLYPMGPVFASYMVIFLVRSLTAVCPVTTYIKSSGKTKSAAFWILFPDKPVFFLCFEI